MNRRNFFKRFATVSAAAIAAPVVAKEIMEMVGEPEMANHINHNPPQWASLYDVEFDPKVWRELSKNLSIITFR